MQLRLRAEVAEVVIEIDCKHRVGIFLNVHWSSLHLQK